MLLPLPLANDDNQKHTRTCLEEAFYSVLLLKSPTIDLVHDHKE